MDLAKQHIDVGIFTSDEQAMLAFWQEEVGLPFEESLALGRGSMQQRHGMNGSVFKINVAPELAPGPQAGYRALAIARDGIASPREMTDPAGNRVTLVPPGHEGVTGIALDLAVRDEAAHHKFYGHALGLEAAGENAYRIGDSLIRFARSDDAAQVGEMQGPGYRYITIQVRDIDHEHAGFLERGATEGRAPVTLGEIARISFLRDPDGNWIEVSQRASLTGALPQ